MLIAMALTPVEVGLDVAGTDLKPSARLLRAADAEREEIERQRARLAGRRAKLADELSEIEASLATLAEREALLGRLVAPPAGVSHEQRGVEVSGDPGPEPAAADASVAGRRVLRGPAIRETAVAVLLRVPQAGAVHYREWYEMVASQGYEVAGKDPVAVFLTQITRSPVVKRSTQAGVYSLDLDAPARLRGELTRLESSLREVTSAGSTTFSEIRARREQLLSEIRRTERGLTEAERVLATLRVDEPHAATA
jgi:hypothetical protein